MNHTQRDPEETKGFEVLNRLGCEDHKEEVIRQGIHVSYFADLPKVLIFSPSFNFCLGLRV